MNRKVTPAPRKSAVNERTKRVSPPEERGERGATTDAIERLGEGLLSEDEVTDILRNEFEQTALPSPPPIAGFHLCWISTTSSYDTLQKRLRLGYKPVRRDELGNFDPSNGQELAQYEGYVTCNEMILLKLPETVYQQIMKYFHHSLPLQEESSIVAQTKAITEHDSQREAMNKPALKEDMGDGMTELERSVKHGSTLSPSFS